MALLVMMLSWYQSGRCEAACVGQVEKKMFTFASPQALLAREQT